MSSETKFNFDEHHSKGFTSEETWERFVKAVHAGDTFETRNAILASGSERKIVDPLIFNQLENITRISDLDLVEKHKPVKQGSIFDQDYKEQDEFIFKLSELRDTPLDSLDLSDLPEGMTQVSYF